MHVNIHIKNQVQITMVKQLQEINHLNGMI